MKNVTDGIVRIATTTGNIQWVVPFGFTLDGATPVYSKEVTADHGR